MAAGKMDRRVQFRRYTEVDDGYGVTEAWADHGGAVWASRNDVSDGEKSRAGTVQAAVMARFVVRSSTATREITPKDRLTEGGLEWNIVGIKQIGRNDRLEITATARLDEE